MAMNRTVIVAGVFQQESQARRALQALRDASFRPDQIGYATQGQQEINLLDNLQDLGLDRESAGYYDQEFRAGHPVVSVRPDGREQEAHDILHRFGSYDYEHRSGMAQSDTATEARDTVMNRPAVERADVEQPAVEQADVRQPASDERDDYYQPRRLRLREEQLDVNKERVASGEARLRKEIVTEQQTIDVPVMHEEVYIERRPVAERRVDTAPIGSDETIRIPISEEQANVEKRTVVTGEVGIGKRQVEENRQFTDTVRREEARVEHAGNARLQGDESLQERDSRLQRNEAARTDDSDNRLL